MRLFDTSSIIEILTSQGMGAADLLGEGARTELTLFEVGNVVWKSRGPHPRRDDAEAIRRIKEAGRVISLMSVAGLQPSEAGEVIEIILRNGLSFYDASYLYLALRDGFTLVTEDEALRKAAVKEGCPVEKVGEIESP